MNRNRRLASMPAIILAAGSALAGPLDPPAGPVGSTGKTLTEVQPRIAINAVNTPGDADSLFKITQPGSYYLTGNVTGVGGKHGIEVEAGGVTIDLMGFTLSGVAGMGAMDGIRGSFAIENIKVMNGTIRAWGADGIDFSAYPRCSVDGVRAIGNVGRGISLGSDAIVAECVASNNSAGIAAQGSTAVRSCTASSNSGHGISVSNDSVVETCTASSNGINGIHAASGSVVRACAATLNAGRGISVHTGSSVIGCTASENGGDGIEITARSLAMDNVCTGNGVTTQQGAGIYASASDNRIEGNHCQGNDLGLDIDGARSVIVRNTCASNTVLNWAIEANNLYGPIIDRSAATTAAVVGNAAAGTLGTTDPNANFTH
ncbi:MAG TPA: right-handed parallel beta-helix repeat-containing protein [Phycisphaerales bacterium]|nr:right-handed parallel beta-helix repeat-containing protein [Phycisphaerales bacterium]